MTALTWWRMRSTLLATLGLSCSDLQAVIQLQMGTNRTFKRYIVREYSEVVLIIFTPLSTINNESTLLNYSVLPEIAHVASVGIVRAAELPFVDSTGWNLGIRGYA